MYRKSVAVGLAAMVLGASPAFAVTVTNQDSKAHTIVINDGKTSKQEQVAPKATITADCPTKCGFRDLAFGTDRLAGGNAKLVIDKDGELHFQGGKGDFQLPNGTN